MWPPWRLPSSTWTAYDRPPLAARHRPKRVILTARQPPDPPPARRLGRACLAGGVSVAPTRLLSFTSAIACVCTRADRVRPFPASRACRVAAATAAGDGRPDAMTLQLEASRSASPRTDRGGGVVPRRSDVVVELWPRGQPARDRLVERPALVARLVRSTAPLAVLTAPAGYGKTTLLAQWEKCDARPFIWIDVTEHDDDLAGVLGGLDGGRGSIVVVLDNAHALGWADTPGVVSAVAARLGAGSTVALASRAEPRLPLAPLRAQGSVLELGARSLAMSREQATELLTLAGLDAERAEVRGIVRRSEGWPAALRLAAGVLREQGDDGVAPVRLRGDDRVLTDYVRLEVLAGLNADEQELLVRTSPCERLCGALCDAVLDRAGSGLVLRELARGGGPLIPLDRAEQEFRLHPLVAAVLRSELQRAEPHLERAIHRRASAWFEQAGERDRAIDAAITAGDLDRAAALID